ncbi:MAG: hypothetical protein Q9174_003775 [Haloplaca sp. 1 TL-2023]
MPADRKPSLDGDDSVLDQPFGEQPNGTNLTITGQPLSPQKPPPSSEEQHSAPGTEVQHLHGDDSSSALQTHYDDAEMGAIASALRENNAAPAGHALSRTYSEPGTHQLNPAWLMQYPNERAKNSQAQIQNFHPTQHLKNKSSHRRKTSTGRTKTQMMYTSHPRQPLSTYSNGPTPNHQRGIHIVPSQLPVGYGVPQLRGQATASEGDGANTSQSPPDMGTPHFGANAPVSIANGASAGFPDHHFGSDFYTNGATQFGSFYTQEVPIPNVNLPIPQTHQILKSQPHRAIDADTMRSASPHPAMTGKKQPRPVQRGVETDNEDDEDDGFNLAYNSIEKAREAERPKFRVRPKNDLSIPKNAFEQKKMIDRMLRCMLDVDSAQDNIGMVRQWRKLRQDEARVEQAAWRILDMVLQIHLEGKPMLPNKPSCNRYGSMMERWDAICRGLRTQKTMCKHLLGAEFTAQLVNDPLTATQRVTNNRKVNAGKSAMYHDRRERKKQTRRSNSSGGSLKVDNGDDEDDIGQNFEEDAEGETDHEIDWTAQVANNPPAATAPMTGTSVQNVKRARSDEESDDNEHRAKMPKRFSSAHHQRSARAKGTHSMYQVIGNVMYDLNDKANEDVVYRDGTAQQQNLFTRKHYPNGKPGRPVRRAVRAAAPKTFEGMESDDGEGDRKHTPSTDDEAEEYGHGHAF